MKLKLTILFLAVASIAMAQKKEMKKIEKAIEKGEFNEAQEIFRTIDESAVEEKFEGKYQFYKAANILDLSGETKASLEDLRNAEAALFKAKDLDFTDPKLEPFLENMIQTRKFELAQEKVENGEPEIALKLVEELYKYNPDNLEMLYSAGNLAYNNKMFDKAVEKYTKLLDENYTGVKTTYLAKNKAGVVVNFPNKIMRDQSVKIKTHTNPTSETTVSKLGDIVLKTVWLYKNKGDADKAKSIYEKAKKDHPDDASLKLVKADIFLTLEMMEEYKEAVENVGADIKDPKIFNNLGDAAMKTKNYDSAMRYFESSLNLAPNDYYVLINLSNANLEKGNLKETSAGDQKVFYKEAIKYLEKAHQVKPEEKGVMTTLVSLYDFLGMKEKSAAMKAKM